MAKNFNAAGMKAANEKKREAARNAIITALRAAGSKGLTQRDLVVAANVSDHTVRAHMPSIRAEGHAHVGPWELHGTKLMPTYIYGPGVDAKRDDYMHLLADITIVDVEREARREAERRHQKRQRDWKPRRAEAAWF
ncbi:hypothetical protein R16034_00855 [Ralstonia edaphis]|uniref:Winged helix-turn-helix domain-containing protein n=1 Tax=Ralstonia edaphi TaxID=3058599 RepID=A0AB72WZG8_9RALS|nr:hypothetical protein [Ralstonia sp. LMG 6871]CAJ0737807.1 hypothetical protein R16034_00855 [Ralstonia sp. LMG 6871]